MRSWASRFFTDRVILLIGWLWFLVYAYPGYMSADSLWQLKQARSAEYNDWHPPMMAFIWRYLDKIVAGPILMLALQSLAFLIGLYALLSRVMSRRAAAITAAVALLLPQNIIVMAVIWKDSQMAGFIVAAVAALLSQKRRWRVAGYVLLFLATAVRYNAAAPIFPIILVLFDSHRSLHWLRRYATAIGLWVGITIAAFVANGLITKVKLHPWPVGAASVDVVGTLRFADEVDLDQLVRETPDVLWAADTTKLRERIVLWYRPENSFNKEFDGASAVFQYPQTAPQRDAIGKLWWKVVREHPVAFIEHRTHVLAGNLNGGVLVWSAFVPTDDPTVFQDAVSHSTLQQRWVDCLVRLTRMRVFRAHLYWLLSLTLIFLTRRNRIAFALYASGICHELGLLAIAPAVDYRYNHWMVATTIIATILVFVQRLRGDGIAARDLPTQ